MIAMKGYWSTTLHSPTPRQRHRPCRRRPRSWPDLHTLEHIPLSGVIIRHQAGRIRGKIERSGRETVQQQHQHSHHRRLRTSSCQPPRQLHHLSITSKEWWSLTLHSESNLPRRHHLLLIGRFLLVSEADLPSHRIRYGDIHHQQRPTDHQSLDTVVNTLRSQLKGRHQPNTELYKRVKTINLAYSFQAISLSHHLL